MRRAAARVLLTAGLALAAGLLFTWPLARHAFEGIPSSSQNVERGHARTLVPGDHLQLLYHYWLFADWLGGGTPWFHNLYEFNTGEDAARREPSAGYLPFPLVFALGQAAGGRAFGYNLTLFACLWGTLVFTWLLARRYATAPGAALAATAAAVFLPFRWVNLLGGSPAGFGMMWIPLLFYGLDVAVRDGRRRGGVLAGLAAVLLSWSDTHGLFFGLLAAPGWCLLALAARGGFAFRDGRTWRRWAGALAPFVLLVLAAVLYNRFWHRQIGESAAAGGRRWGEIALFSPAAEGLWQWRREGKESHVYLGLPVLLAWCAGLAALAWRAARDRAERRPAWLAALLTLALLGVTALALGTNGPAGAVALRAARRLVPPYAMVRQPAKVFTLVPPLLAAGLAVGLSGLLRAAPRRAGLLLAAAATAVFTLDYRAQVRPTVCLLPARQAAYAAAAEAPPGGLRALAVPLWPGDSDYGSVYEYYASLHRLRLLNGYKPVVERRYVEEIFRAFESVNQGGLSGEQADALAGRGVGHVLLHEDLFPEKVSPFPVGVTLGRLLENERLQFVRREGSVWCFRLLEEPRAAVRAVPARERAGFLPAWQWPAQRLRREGPPGLAAGAPGKAVRLVPGAVLSLPRPVTAAPAPGLAWQVRLRGAGTVVLQDGDAGPAVPIDVDTDAWEWAEAPLAGHAVFGPLAPRLEGARGVVEVDRLVLTAGGAAALPPGARTSWPAAAFFHAGHTDGAHRDVYLRAAWEPDGLVFYGPKQRLAAGRYRVGLRFRSDAPPDTALGRFNVRRRNRDEGDWVDVRAGREASRAFEQPEDVPFFLAFHYYRAADMALESVTLERLH